ncbi:MAG: phosphohexomutase domain-containing protein, partial [Carboxydocellales bacterium]
QVVLTSGADIGVAADGDGDRLGAMDEQGRYVSAQQLFPLLLEHLVKNRGWRGKVCKTFSTTSRVDLVAAKYQLPVITTPIGFKYICPHFLSTEVLMGGEESGGFGFQNHLPERDGMLSALFLLELLVHSGKSLSTLLAEQDREFGTQVYQRIDLALKPTNSAVIQTRLKTLHIETYQDSLEFTDQAAGLAEHLGMPIAEVSHLDGTKFTMIDGSWLLLRSSGTEPVLRLYAEASSQDQVEKMLEWAAKVADEPAGC